MIRIFDASNCAITRGIMKLPTLKDFNPYQCSFEAIHIAELAQPKKDIRHNRKKYKRFLWKIERALIKKYNGVEKDIVHILTMFNIKERK